MKAKIIGVKSIDFTPEGKDPINGTKLFLAGFLFLVKACSVAKQKTLGLPSREILRRKGGYADRKTLETMQSRAHGII